jgi:hypothetical protein
MALEDRQPIRRTKDQRIRLGAVSRAGGDSNKPSTLAWRSVIPSYFFHLTFGSSVRDGNDADLPRRQVSQFWFGREPVASRAPDRDPGLFC